MIEYQEMSLTTDGSMLSVLVELNRLGKDDWQLVSPLKRIDSRTYVCIMSKRRLGRPPKEENGQSQEKED